MKSNRTNTHRARQALGAFFVASAAIAFVACSENPATVPPNEPSTAPTVVTPSSESTPSPTSAPSEDVTLAWALDYTKGTPVVASGDPIKIGFANSSDFFPAVDEGAQVAVDYVNNYLGGVAGRPIEIVSCTLTTQEDGAKCGAEFANDPDITIAMIGSALAGSSDFFNAVAGKKASYTATPLGVDDFLSTTSVSYAGGALSAGMGIATYVLELAPKTVAVVATDDVAGRGGFSVFEGIVKPAGITLSPVFVPPTATAPEVEAAMRAVNAQNADALVIGLFEQGCIAAYDALKSMGIDGTAKNIISTSVCWGPAVREHLASAGDGNALPNGWYFSWDGYSPFIPNAESGMDTYLAAMNAAGKGDIASSYGVGSTFAAIFSMTRLLNDADGDFSSANLDTLIRGFTGPSMLMAGDLACGTPTVFKGVCRMKASITRFIDGSWQATHEGEDSLDLTPALVIG